MDPLERIDVRRPREVDASTPITHVRLTPAEREEARERREQARKRRRKAASPYAQPGPDADGHVDLTA